MTPFDSELLKDLGRGNRIEEICTSRNLSRQEFDAWWREQLKARVPALEGSCSAAMKAGVRIHRDKHGIAHVLAANDEDLFFGYGFAMAQDRLFQMDYLRKKGQGRLAEILGRSALESDLTSRTVRLPQIAEVEWDSYPQETKRLVSAFTAGVNAWINQSRAAPPIECSLLDYEIEPWRETDCCVIAGEFRWYLTGRFPVICIPELVKRELGDTPLYRAFLTSEADDECIVPGDQFVRRRQHQAETLGPSGANPHAGEGSNNWVVAGNRTQHGMPMLASDPHIAFAAVSCWYEVHLKGGSFNTAGMTYAGIPAVMFGRNERVAWGITNNICSQRDLYLEQTDPNHPNCYLYEGEWKPGRSLHESITVRGEAASKHTIRFSHNGPIVDDILPKAAQGVKNVSLRWVGAYPCGWLTALLGMDRAADIDELRAATRPWLCPTFSVVCCDRQKNIGYQCTGRIPLRSKWERGYRPGWEAEHQWGGLIPFEEMPRATNPPSGFVISANNRTAADDYPYFLAGTWTSGHRALRIRQMIEPQSNLTLTDMARMQLDALSLRAVECVPRLVRALESVAEPALQSACQFLLNWDGHMETDRSAALLFDVFFANFMKEVTLERFSGETAEFIAQAATGLASSLLGDDPHGWFCRRKRTDVIAFSMRAALEEIARRFALDRLSIQQGDLSTLPRWGALHQLKPAHFLSTRGDLGTLLDLPSRGVKGDMTTVCNTGNDPQFQAATGAGYRYVTSMHTDPPELWAIDAGGGSGAAGSPHYADQLDDWHAGLYHTISLANDGTSPGMRTWEITPR